MPAMQPNSLVCSCWKSPRPSPSAGSAACTYSLDAQHSVRAVDEQQPSNFTLKVAVTLQVPHAKWEERPIAVVTLAEGAKIEDRTLPAAVEQAAKRARRNHLGVEI
eukprot:6480559-Amphidinium_carterae.1